MKRISLLVIALIFSLVALGESLPQPSQSPKTNQASECNKRNSDNTPSPINVTCTNASENYSRSESNKGDNEPPRGISFLEIINTFAAVAVAVFGGLLWYSTEKMWIASTDATKIANRAADAAKDTAEAVKGSTEVAQKNADTFRIRIEKQSRAYLTTDFGSGWYQDRATNTYFGVQAKLINTGHTPAKHVRNKLRAGILPTNLTEQTQFPLPEEWYGDGLIGPGQFFFIQSLLPDFIDDNRAIAIKNGTGTERLYFWGIIIYTDVFDIPRTLKFCHTIHWVDDHNTRSFMTPIHNESD